MSLRFASGINSSFFMSDPVPIDNQKDDDQEQKYLIKGEDDVESKELYDHIDHDEDILIVNSEGGSFQLHRKTLRDILTELKGDSHLSVKQLTPERTESFRSIVETLRLLYGSQALYDLVLKDVHEIFSDVKNVKPGTVAAFFVGCFNDDKFSGPMGCGPKCAASLPPSEGTPGYANCDDLVLIYENNMFSSLNDVRSQHAYIYTQNNNFYGFTSENIKQLKDAGIEKSSLIFGNPDGSYGEMGSPVNVDNLPQVAQTNVAATNNVNANNTGSGAGAVVFVIIIVIMLLLLAVLFSRYGFY